MENNLISEAKKIASVLRIPVPEIRMTDCMVPVEHSAERDENGKWFILICSNLDAHMQMSMLIREMRVFWQKLHGYLDKAMFDNKMIDYYELSYDALKFEMGYRYFIRNEGNLEYHSDDCFMDCFIAEYIEKMVIFCAMFGTCNERKYWLSQIYKTEIKTQYVEVSFDSHSD